MSQPATPHISIYGHWCHRAVYDNAKRLQPTSLPTEILYAISFQGNTSANGIALYHIVPHRHHTDGIHLSFLLRWRYRPSPFVLPIHTLTYITRQQSSNAASRLATRQGDARSATLFLGKGPPTNTYGGPFHTTRPKYIRRGAHPCLSQPHSPSGAQTSTMGPLWGVQFCTSHFGPNFGGCNFWTPHFGPIRVTCPFFQF